MLAKLEAEKAELEAVTCDTEEATAAKAKDLKKLQDKIDVSAKILADAQAVIDEAATVTE